MRQFCGAGYILLYWKKFSPLEYTNNNPVPQEPEIQEEPEIQTKTLEEMSTAEEDFDPESEELGADDITYEELEEEVEPDVEEEPDMEDLEEEDFADIAAEMEAGMDAMEDTEDYAE